MVTFEIETPFYSSDEFWTTLTVTCEVTAYGTDELEVHDGETLVHFETLHPEIKTAILSRLDEYVEDRRIWAGPLLTSAELSDERA